MDREQAVVYLRFSGFSDEQIKAIEWAFACPSTGIDCEDCPAYEKKSEWEHDHEILKAYSDGASAVLDKVRAEIEQTEINGHIRDVECFRAGIDVALNVIAKYRAESENRE